MGCISSKDHQVIQGGNNKNKTNDDGTPKYPIYGPASIMKKKEHGSSATPVQSALRWNCDYKTAKRICNHNRHFAEHSGYFEERPEFLAEVEERKKTKTRITFYDSNTTGKPLFYAPTNRSWHAFWVESKAHGWPSFRDDEVNWDHVRCLKGGEVVSLAGTHLGHNLPDGKGNRYCINLVSIAGIVPEHVEEEPTEESHSPDEAAPERENDA